MQPERLRRVHDIVDAASGLTGAARRRYLERQCGGDAELRRYVEGMLAALAAEDEAEDDIGAVVRGAAAQLDDRPGWIGKAVGPYRIVAKIADGGMGSVFRAERADGELEQQVAVKVLRSAFASRDLRRRFLSERQILADLNHPNICKLLDGGTTDEGLPFLAMELVDGLPIDEYCDTRALSTQSRLELFCQVCAAVEHAHRNLIVHRDLKPSNIIVDASGVPKLLDFGIAKLLDDDARMGHTIAQTRYGMRMLTPEYASPEQVRGQPITTAADVYALGVVLYQLLSGRSPYAVTGHTVRDMERAICETDPKRPSTVVASAAPDPGDTTRRIPATRIAEARGTSPVRLRKALAGDLDNIVLMAMRKEPEHRYRSVQALSQDIRNYLDDAPVSAHPTSWHYHAGKFFRRNRLAVLGTGAALATIASLVVFYTLQVTRERDRAQLEADKAAQVSGFLAGLFEVSDPSESVGETITARSLLDQGAQRIDAELADQPAVQAAMQDVMGGVYRGLGLYDESERLLDAALATRRDLHAGDHPDVLGTLVKQGALSMSKGEYPLAQEQLEEALAMSRRIHGAEHPITARLMTELAGSIHVQGRYDQAERLYRDALAMQERLFDGAHADKAQTRQDLGRLLGDMGDLAGAAATLRAAIAMFVETNGRIHPTVPAAMNDLAYVLQELGELDEAERVMREALQISERVYGKEHPDVNGDRFTLASIVREQGDVAGAEELFRQVLATDRRLLGDEHPYVALSQNNLAGTLIERGRYGEAEALYRASLALNRKLHGDEHPEVATSLSNLGVLLGRAGRFDEAGELFDAAHGMRRRLLGPEHPATLTSQNIYAQHLYAIGDFAAARAMFEKSIAERTRVLGADHPHLALTFVRYGSLLRELGDTQGAETAIRRGIAIQIAVYHEEHRALAPSRLALARALAAQGRRDAADQVYRRALAQYRRDYAPGHPGIADVALEYGRFMTAKGEVASGQAMLREALELRLAALPDGHWQIGVAQSVLGENLAAAGEQAEARQMLDAGHALLVRARGPDDRWTRRAAARRTAALP